MPDSDEAENLLVIELVRSCHTVLPPKVGRIGLAAEPHYRSGPGAGHVQGHNEGENNVSREFKGRKPERVLGDCLAETP